MKPLYRRILLKLSGEAMRGREGAHTLYDSDIMEHLCSQICTLREAGVDVAIVIGGGNIFRGSQHGVGHDQTTDHFIGMAATNINGMLFQEVLRKRGAHATCLTALESPRLCPQYTPTRARKLLNDGHIVILAGGSGNPFCSTDFAGVLRATELDAEIMFKATKVDGIFDKDPVKYADAQKLAVVSYDYALQENLQILDQTAFAMARSHHLPIQVFDIFMHNRILEAVASQEIGSLVSN